MKISVISGGFDPIHSGHIEYLKSASKLGDYLVVLLNSDEWLIKKKGKAFMPFKERMTILKAISYVDDVYAFDDDSLGSCINGLLKVKKQFPKEKIIFCNGGDRDKNNIPEMNVDGIQFNFGTGGNDKKNSSSWILKEWSYPYEKRIWGEFFNLFEAESVKVKELIIDPKKGMSLQRHYKRNEIWLVSEGKCIVNFSKSDPSNIEKYELLKHDFFHIKISEWHQITNPFNEVCKIIEIQYGEETIEEDIERIAYYDE